MKPDRSPDFVLKPGHAFWFSEMIFMHVYGQVYKIETDQADGSLYFVAGKERHPMFLGVRELYDKWFYELFESKFLGEE